ncbi:MAG: hypothetical protein RLZZ588_186 [Chloroflexota bacterium]
MKEAPLERIDDLLSRLLDRVTPLSAEVVDIDLTSVEDLLGRVLASPLRAAVSHPPSDVSAMDGWAIRSADIERASGPEPVVLACVGDAAAGGSVASTELARGQCRRIATGATIPPGADCVVPVERSHLADPRHGSAPLARSPATLPSSVWFTAPLAIGAHIRGRGEDMKVSDQLAEAGSLIDAALLSVIYTSGARDLRLYPRPRVAILTSGDELSNTAGLTQIRDSNGPALSALVMSEGAQVVSVTNVGDDAAATQAAVERLSPLCDVLVTSGGVSVGAHDHVGAALESHFDLIAWRAAIQPGKPLVVGERRSGAPGAKFALGVPGNPVSAFVIGVEVLLPLIRTLAGRPAYGVELEGVLEEEVQSPIGRRSFLRLAALRTSSGDLDRDSAGRIRVRLAGGQGSHQTAPLAACDALGVVPEEVGSLAVGAAIRLHPLSRAVRRVAPPKG